MLIEQINLRALALITLFLSTHAFFVPYMLAPERYFIKRFRYKGLITHVHLILRAYAGMGLVFSSVYVLFFGLAFDLTTTTRIFVVLVGSPISGTMHYIILRFLYYRRVREDNSAGFRLRKSCESETAAVK